MNKPKPKLQIVPYQPDNYSGAEVLALEDATIISSAGPISAALSLYFEWEKKRFAQIIFKQGPHQKPIECTMSYDQDELSPTEIRVRLHRHKKSLEVVPGSEIIMRFEIFRVSYEFTVEVAAVSADPKKEDWHVIIDVPSELKVLKSRKLPRLRLTKEARQDLPPAFFMVGDGKKVELELLEIGMGTVRGKCRSVGSGKTGKFILGDVVVDAGIIRSGEGEIVFSIKFEDSTTFGKYFDEYRKVAYPSLRSRYDFPYEVGVELYEKTGYFDTFKAKKTPEEKKEIMDTWEAIKTGFHHTNADYYVIDSEGRPIGCSGLAITNFIESNPVWVFHQTCALKNPSYIEQSGNLYTWRAEYLAASFADVMTWGTFRSQSRWLERIYVKHTNIKNNKSNLLPILMKKCEFQKSDNKSVFKFTEYLVGKIIRTSTISNGLWGGIHPKFLNASGNLNTVIAMFDQYSVEELIDIAGQLINAAKKNSLELLLVCPHKTDLSRIGGVTQVQDRMFNIPKTELINFISSVDHSIAVSERKIYGVTSGK